MCVAGRGAECRQNRPYPGRGWNGRLHPMWPVAGPYQNLQVGKLLDKGGSDFLHGFTAGEED